MTHLDEGRVQAFLDGELSTHERAAAAEHMLECASCRRLHDDLRRASALFSQALTDIDVPAPADRPVPGLAATARWGMASLARAAVLVLLLAAAASAAVPGSPVRSWVEQAIGLGAPAEEPAQEQVVEAPGPIADDKEPSADAAAPVALSVTPRAGRVQVELSAMEGTAIRVRSTTAQRLSLSVSGADRDPSFQVREGAIGARGAVGGELLIEVPESLAAGQILRDGQVLARVRNGRLDIRVPGHETAEGVLWR